MRNPLPGFCRVGCQPGWAARKDAGSLCRSPISTSATIRPPTGPRCRPCCHQLRLFQHVVPERRRLVEAARPKPFSSATSCRRAPAPHRLGDRAARTAASRSDGGAASAAAARSADRGSRSLRAGGRRAASRCFVSIRLFGFTWPSPKSKNVCQPTKRRGARAAAAEVDGIAWPCPGGSKMNPKNGSAVVALRGSPGTTAEPCCGRSGRQRRLELDRNERLAERRLVEAASVARARRRPAPGRRRAAGTRAGPATGSATSSPAAPARTRRPPDARRPQRVDRLVVEEDERAVQPRDDHVLVVSRIAEDRADVRRARQVLEEPAGLDLQLRAVDRVVQLRRADRPASVDGVEIEGGVRPLAASSDQSAAEARRRRRR